MFADVIKIFRIINSQSKADLLQFYFCIKMY